METQSEEFEIADRTDQFENVERERAERFANDFQKLQEEVRTATPENWRVISQKIEAKLEKVDDIVTTLFQDEELSEEEIEQARKDLGKELKKIEKQGASGYNLSVKELKEGYKKLHERTDARIREWYVYMIDLADLKADLHEKILNALDEERIHTEAAEKIEHFWTDRTEEHMTVLTDRISNLGDQLKDRVDLKIQQEITEYESRFTRMETQLEYYKKQNEKKNEIIRLLAEDNAPVSDEVQSKAEEVVDDMSRSVEEIAQNISSNGVDNGGDDNGDGPVAELVEEEDEETDDVDRYVFSGLSIVELRESFKTIAEEEPVNSVNAEELASKTDIDADKLRDRYRRVKDSFDDFDVEIPAFEES